MENTTVELNPTVRGTRSRNHASGASYHTFAEEDARIKAEEEAKLKAEEEARVEAERLAKLQAEEEARLKRELEERLKDGRSPLGQDNASYCICHFDEDRYPQYLLDNQEKYSYLIK